MKYIDIHSHLDSPEYDADRGDVLARMEEAGVGTITIGADLESSKKAVEIAEANENIWACIGVHPENISQGEGWTELFEELVKSPQVVAIGECGLDYFRLDSEEIKHAQKKLFESQIEFALKHDKSLMLHIRTSGKSNDAHGDAFEILNAYKKESGEKLRGNVHFFTGDTQIAKKFLDLGFTLSFTGVVTFSGDYNGVIEYIPQNSILSETDAPWVAPVPFRGKRNEPSYVTWVIQKLAEIRREDEAVLNAAILGSSKRVFGIDF